MKKLLYSLLAVGGLATSAFAAPASGDILISFFTSAGTGSGTEVTIDAGQFTSFIVGNGATFSIGGFSATDLSNTYGSTWYNRTDLSWGAVGAVKNTQSGLVASSTNSYGFAAGKDTLFNTGLNTTGAGTTSAQAQSSAVIQPIYTLLAGSSVNGAGSAAYIIANAATTAGSFDNAKISGANQEFKYFATNTVMQTSNPGLAGTVTQDLYETIPTGVSGTTGGVYKLGTFSLTSSGLTFTSTSSAIPEPSTYAAIAGVVMLGFVSFRRRFRK